MSIGRAVHCRLLEPELFDTQFVVYPGKVKRGKEWEQFKADNLGADIMKFDDLQSAVEISNAVTDNELAAELLKNSTATEVSIFWTDPLTGLYCKGRLDFLKCDEYMGDVKTTLDVAPVEFSRSVAKFRYYSQFAFYQEGYKVITGENLPFKVIAAQSKPPHEVMVYNVSNDCFNAGNTEVTAMMELLKECIDSGEYPKIGQEETELYLPSWQVPFGQDTSDPF
jgi:hypothetical protein